MALPEGDELAMRQGTQGSNTALYTIELVRALGDLVVPSTRTIDQLEVLLLLLGDQGRDILLELVVGQGLDAILHCKGTTHAKDHQWMRFWSARDSCVCGNVQGAMPKSVRYASASRSDHATMIGYERNTTGYRGACALRTTQYTGGRRE